VSGTLHPAFTAIGYDGVLLDHCVQHGLGRKWLEDLLCRPHFPPVVYFGPGHEPGDVTSILELGALEYLVRQRIDHRRLATAIREGVRRRRHALALLRTSGAFDEASRFGPVTILGHRFVRELAAGGNSMVYLAESERAGEMVVLKVLADDSDGSDELHFMRFLQEYELISKIRHPNVVRILDLGIADDHAFIAMEYFPQGDLRKVLHRDEGMVVGDAEIENAHHVRMADLRDELVFLQEAHEMQLVGSVRIIGKHLEHDHLARALAFRQVHHRVATCGKLAHETMAQDRDRTKARCLVERT